VKKLGKILLFALIFGVFGMVSAFCAEDVQTFSVNIVVNGDEYAEAEIGASVDGNVYTFQVNELLEALGLNLTYDEETDIATLSAEPDTLAAVLFSELEPSEEPSGEPSGEPSVEPAADPSGEPAGEPTEESMPESEAEPADAPADEASAEPSGEMLTEAAEAPASDSLAGIAFVRHWKRVLPTY